MSRPLYLLLIAAPLAIVADLLHWPAPVVFGLSALGVVPLAGLRGVSVGSLRGVPVVSLRGALVLGC